MASSYSARYSKPLGAHHSALGGLGAGLPINVLDGETDFRVLVEDFDSGPFGPVDPDTSLLETGGWVINDNGVTATNLVSINNILAGFHDSCMTLATGATVSAGTNMQLTVPFTTPAASSQITANKLMNFNPSAYKFSFVWGTRVGFTASGASWAAATVFGMSLVDAAIMTTAGVLADTTAWLPDGGILFHVNTSGSVDLGVHADNDIRWASTGTTTRGGVFTLPAAVGVSGQVFYDFVFRADWAGGTEAGSVQAYYRRVPALSTGRPLPPYSKFGVGVSGSDVMPLTGASYVNSLELINGAAGEATVAFDWIINGITRYSRIFSG